MDTEDLTTHTPEELQAGITARLNEQERRRLELEPASPLDALKQQIADLERQRAELEAQELEPTNAGLPDVL